MAAAAQPTAILRGHRGQIQAAAFMREGRARRLAVGDGSGFVVLWDLAIVRPRAVWRAHTQSILGIAGWGDDQLATHGRDHKLVVWQVGETEEARLSTALPLESEAEGEAAAAGAGQTRPLPWTLHVLDVNAMNFCAFAWCGFSRAESSASVSAPALAVSQQRLIAVPNTLVMEAVDIFHLPSQRRVFTAKLGSKEDGMVMAVALFYPRGGGSSSKEGAAQDGRAARATAQPLVLVAGFENGVAAVATLDGLTASSTSSTETTMTIRYRARVHSQPILSLDVAPDQSYFLTSAADAIIAKHPIPPIGVVSTTVDDAVSLLPMPMPSPSPLPTQPQPHLPTPQSGKAMSLLSAAFANASPTAAAAQQPALPPPPPDPETQPLTAINTKHAGQQGLRIRADGRIFATAGWDARVRVYSCKTMKQLAVLKWHQTGCYAVAFAPVADSPANASAAAAAATQLVPAAAARDDASVKSRRLRHAATAHWLAAGSKDGKISLWDIF